MKINKLGIRTHLKLGLFYGVLASVVQGFAEALILSIKSSDFIFWLKFLRKFYFFIES